MTTGIDDPRALPRVHRWRGSHIKQTFLTANTDQGAAILRTGSVNTDQEALIMCNTAILPKGGMSEQQCGQTRSLAILRHINEKYPPQSPSLRDTSQSWSATVPLWAAPVILAGLGFSEYQHRSVEALAQQGLRSQDPNVRGVFHVTRLGMNF